MICRAILFCFALLIAGPCLAAPATFRDCSECPEMVIIPAGSFKMGAASGEALADTAFPQHAVTFRKAFAVGIYDVTFNEWDNCLNDNGCDGYPAASNDWGRSNRPVIYVNWNDAQRYVRWLNKKLRSAKGLPESAADNGPYRLLTEAEWEYAARAGTTTTYYWGEGRETGKANCDGCGSEWDNKKTAPVGSFPPNPFGLYDMAGNILQWVQDCAHKNYEGAPANGAAWETDLCIMGRVMRGGSWFNSPYYTRPAQRFIVAPDFRAANGGFRVAKTLE